MICKCKLIKLCSRFFSCLYCSATQVRRLPKFVTCICDNIKTFLLSIFFVEMNTTVVTTCSFCLNANIAFPS